MNFKITQTGCIIQLRHIQYRDAKGKLAKPIYFFQYIGRECKLKHGFEDWLNRDREDIRCYLEDVQRNILFKTWIEI